MNNSKAKTVRLSQKRQIAIPASVCGHLHLAPGQELIIEEYQGRIILRPKPTSYSQALKGIGKKSESSLDPLQYLQSERASWD